MARVDVCPKERIPDSYIRSYPRNDKLNVERSGIKVLWIVENGTN